ncbi:hypothetical protein D3C80_1662260 [compost metagenome]
MTGVNISSKGRFVLKRFHFGPLNRPLASGPAGLAAGAVFVISIKYSSPIVLLFVYWLYIDCNGRALQEHLKSYDVFLKFYTQKSHPHVKAGWLQSPV